MKHELETDLVHGGREDLDALGVHALPLDLSSTYPCHDLDQATASIDSLVEGDADAYTPVYQRLCNPTVRRLERAMAGLERCQESVAFASGMAAMTAVLMAAKMRGAHVVAVRPVYGGTDHLLATGLLGLDVSWAEADGVADAIREDTALVIIETPANPTLRLTDIADVVRQAGEVPVLVDNTFATPALQRPVEHGAALVLHSATKFLGGHGDVVAGLVCCDEDWSRALRQVRILTGGILHPMGAYTVHRGLSTLGVRMERAQRNALELAELLAAHPAVDAVHLPGRGEDHELMQRQMDGPGAVLAFSLRCGYDAARSVISDLDLITPAVSLGSTDTLIQHPAGLTHRVVDDAAKSDNGIHPGLLRLSVGLESVTDLWDDLVGALDAIVDERAA